MPNSSSASQPVEQTDTFSASSRLGLVLLSLGFNYTLMSSVIYPALPGLQAQYHLTAAQLSLMSSLPALVSILFQPASGWVSDRVNRKWIVLLGLCAYILGGNLVGIVLLSSLSSYFWVLAGRFLSGFGELGAFAQYLAIIHEKLPLRNQQRMLGTMEALTSMGSVLAPLIGGALAAVSLHLPFFASGVFGLLALGLAVWGIPNLPPLVPQPAAHPKAAVSRKPFQFHFSYLAGFLIMGILVSTSTFLGSYSLSLFGFSTTQIGFLLAITPLAMAAGSTLAGKLGERGAISTRLLALSGLLGVLGLFLIGGGISPWVTSVGLALSGANLGFWLAIFDHDAMNAGSPETRGLRLSFFQQAKSLGILLFPFLLGNVIDQTGSIRLIYSLLAVSLLVIGIILLKIRVEKINT